MTVTAGCSSISEPSSCTPLFSSGNASTLVSATGDLGDAPTVSFPTPLISTSTESDAISTGDGKTLYDGSIADVQASIYDGATGELLTATDYDPTNPLRLTVGKVDATASAATVIAQAIQCQTVGSRTATVSTVEELFGADTLDPNLGLENDDTLVLVTDIESSFLGRANGPLQPTQSGFPAVVTAVDGTPGITLPSENPPTDLKIEKVRKGDGATVAEGDNVVVHYTEVLWNSDGAEGTLVESTWDAGQPVTWPAVEMTDDADSIGLVPGLATALIGQTVGSQVVVVIPPEFGYPSGSNPDTVPEGSTMVYVFDVLGIQ